jgi:hypothetical protein
VNAELSVGSRLRRHIAAQQQNAASPHSGDEMKLSMLAAIAATAAAVALSTSSAYALSCKGGCPPGPFNPGKKGYAAAESTASCSADLSFMRRVKPAQIEAIDADDHVTVTPYCEGEEEAGVLRASGNAGALRAPIGENPVTMAALTAEDYSNEDVVAVRMTNKGAILYVARYDY